jgi:hypothetical protein
MLKSIAKDRLVLTLAYIIPEISLVTSIIKPLVPIL